MHADQTPDSLGSRAGHAVEAPWCLPALRAGRQAGFLHLRRRLHGDANVPRPTTHSRDIPY